MASLTPYIFFRCACIPYTHIIGIKYRNICILTVPKKLCISITKIMISHPQFIYQNLCNVYMYNDFELGKMQIPIQTQCQSAFSPRSIPIHQDMGKSSFPVGFKSFFYFSHFLKIRFSFRVFLIIILIRENYVRLYNGKSYIYYYIIHKFSIYTKAKRTRLK